MKAESFKAGHKFYIDPAKLLPLERFTGNSSRGGTYCVVFVFFRCLLLLYPFEDGREAPNSSPY